MALSTAFTELIGCERPIQQAPITTAGPALVEAVCRAGALGMLPMGAPSRLGASVADLADAGCGPFGVNFLMPFVRPLGLEATVEEVARSARLVEFFYGAPDGDLIRRVHAGGARAGWQVGTGDEAVAAEDAGCDLIVAQGIEAGGHVRGTLPMLILLEEVVGRVHLPVVAAGGIGGPRTMAAALAGGAAGVRIGTRFVATVESEAHADYIAALVNAGPGTTVVTEAFGVGWPDAPHRVLRSALETAERSGAIVGTDSHGRDIVRFSASPPIAGTTGNVGAMALYAGEGVGAIERVESAADVVIGIADGAEQLLRRWA